MVENETLDFLVDRYTQEPNGMVHFKQLKELAFEEAKCAVAMTYGLSSIDALDLTDKELDRFILCTGKLGIDYFDFDNELSLISVNLSEYYPSTTICSLITLSCLLEKYDAMRTETSTNEIALCLIAPYDVDKKLQVNNALKELDNKAICPLFLYNWIKVINYKVVPYCITKRFD